VYLLPPYGASLVFGWSLATGDEATPFSLATVGISQVLDFAALAVIFAGVFLVSRYRVALDVSQASAQAWHDERDAAVSKSDRLAELVLESKARISALEAQPSLTKMEALLKELVDGQKEIAKVIRQNP